jgi:hydrogenase small subunit
MSSERSGVDRREFVKTISMAAAAIGLPGKAVAKIIQNVEAGLKPSVIWLSNQECTGCTETLLRTTHPGLEELIVDLISLDYHEALCAAAGHQVEEARRAAMERHRGSYVLVIEGSIPTKDDGIYCKIGGQTSLEMVREAAEHAGAIIAIGSCASWGGIPSADPNPTGAAGAPQVLEGKTVVTIPGCPANPYNFLGVVLQYATFGTLPALDELGRPAFAYGRTIHEHCPRRAHFDAGRFARQFGDEGHRLGYCLYHLGCKGPQTHANCSVQHFCEVIDAWPIGLGHPCFGCTEQKFAFRVPLHETIELYDLTPPATYPPIAAEREGPNPWATMVGGAVVGGAIGGGIIAAKKVSQPCEDDQAEEA